MSIADKLATIAENEQKVYDAGRTLGQGDVWDMAQNYGKRRHYNRGFSMWSGVGFKPKYPMKPTNCDYMFSYFAEGDEETVDLRGLDLDTSVCTTFAYMNNFSKIAAFGTIDTTGATAITNIFYNATVLHTIEKLILKDDGSQAYSATGPFLNCYELVNIEVEGKFGANLSLSSSSKLSKNSIYSFMNALLDTASGQTFTIRKTAVNNAFETSEGAADGSTSDEWNALIATKPNWTIALA